MCALGETGLPVHFFLAVLSQQRKQLLAHDQAGLVAVHMELDLPCRVDAGIRVRALQDSPRQSGSVFLQGFDAARIGRRRPPIHGRVLNPHASARLAQSGWPRWCSTMRRG